MATVAGLSQSAGLIRRPVLVYLCAVLGLGHSDQELENGLGLRHQRRDGVDDRCELGVRLNTWTNKDKQSQKDGSLGQPRMPLGHTSESLR